MASKKAKPELKKSDILSALKNPKTGENRTDLTKESLQKELAKSFSFIKEYYSYLFAMYENGGKFEVLDVPEDAEEGTTGLLLIKAMGQIRTTPRDMFTLSVVMGDVEVEYEDDTTGIETAPIVSCERGTLMPGDKLPEGSSLSPASAAKIGKTTAYSVYKATLAALEEWVDAENAESEEEAEAA